MELTSLPYFNNIHEGKQGYVCGSGTSLNDVPKSIVDDGIVICVNSAGLHFDKFHYLYITDPAVPNMEYWDEVVEKSDEIVFANPELIGQAKYTQEKTGKKCYLMTRNYECREDYRLDSQILFMGNDASISATHLACIMGLKPVILCGIDLCYQKGKRYFTDDAYIHKPDSPYKQSFEKDYPLGKIKHEHESDIWLEPSISCWNKIFNQNEKLRDIIVNSSRISRVPHFKKITIG